MGRPRIVRRSRTFPFTALGQPQNINLYEDFQISSNIVVAINLIFRGQMTSTGGGAITGFHRDAPAGVATNIRIEGGYKSEDGQRTVVHAPPQQLFFPGNYFNGVFQTPLITSSGAASTDDFRAVVPIPLRDPNARTAEATYLDIRDYSSLSLQIQDWVQLAGFATTNLSALANLSVEVEMFINEDGPPQGAPHFEPMIIYREMDQSQNSTQVTRDQQFGFPGLLTTLWLQQFDDSAVGNAERTNNIIQRLTVQHDSRNVVDDVQWDAMLRSTFQTYPLTLTTVEHAGVVGIHFSPSLKASGGVATIRRDTVSAIPLGIGADIAPAAGDSLFVTGIVAEPVNGAGTRVTDDV